MKTDYLSDFPFKKIVDMLIRLGVLFLILSWCIDILRPFLLIAVWGGIIAVTIYPLYAHLSKILGNRNVLAVTILTMLMLSLIMVPGWLLFESIYEGIYKIKAMHDAGETIIPPPSSITDTWPAFLQPMVEIWEDITLHMDDALRKYASQLATVGRWLLSTFTSVGFGLIELIASTIIAAVMLTYTRGLTDLFKQLFGRLAGENGEHLLAISIITIRNVVKGIIGVAVIQTAITAVGLFVAGIPYAGLWTIICLVLAIAQVGVVLIAVPACIYMFSVSDTLHASIFTAWMVVALVSDNFLKPILLGRGAPVPMLIVFMGAIGGFIFQGFLGLFLGSVILSLGYKLFTNWLESGDHHGFAETADNNQK